jgi:hypothetical protein
LSREEALSHEPGVMGQEEEVLEETDGMILSKIADIDLTQDNNMKDDSNEADLLEDLSLTAGKILTLSPLGNEPGFEKPETKNEKYALAHSYSSAGTGG